MSALAVTIQVTNPDDPITTRISGPAGIPVISFSTDPYAPTQVDLQLNPGMVSAVGQAAWLRRLAAAAESLAAQVEGRAQVAA